MSVICNFCVYLFSVLVIYSVVIGGLMADIGGGGGESVTPYRKSFFSSSIVWADVEEVSEYKEYTSRNITFYYFPMPELDRIENKSSIAIAYVKSGYIEDGLSFMFVGVDENGDRLQLPFSEVKSFTILSKDEGKLLLDIDHFPAITPEKLLSAEPTYRELLEKYKRKVRLRIPMKRDSGAEVYIMGAERSDSSSKIRPLMPMAEIPIGVLVEFSRSTKDLKLLWWAIPSVANDPAYPYRIMFAH